MTPHTRGRSVWRRVAIAAAAGAVVAAGVVTGSAPVLADPATPNTAAAAPPMTADQALAQVANEYDTGTGGGQISNLIHKITRLRAKGFQPSVANANALVAALDKRPNQAPLIEALQATLNFQQASQSRAMAKPQQPATVGTVPGGVGMGAPGGAISLPAG